MTLNGAIMQLVEMRENSLMPAFFKPCFDKVIETVSECEEPSAQPEVRTDMSSANDTISRQAAIDAIHKLSSPEEYIVLKGKAALIANIFLELSERRTDERT